MAMEMVVRSVAYRAGKRLKDVVIDDISEVVQEPGTFIWVGLWQPDEPLLRKMQEEFHLHDLAIEDALNAHQRPKLEVYGDSLFVVVKTAQLMEGEVKYGETHVFIGKNFLVTVRHGASTSYGEVRARLECNPALLGKGPAFALYSVLDFIVDHYQPIMSSYEAQFDRIEANLFKADFNEKTIEETYELRHQLMELRNAAAPIHEICNQLIRFHEELIPKELRAYLRDVQDHAQRVVAATDDLREMLTNAMHVNLALVTVRQNEIVKRLAGWGAIFALPTVVFSLYGMNFQDMPELKTSWGYPATLAVTVTGCVALYRKLKREAWI
jgi:magnesium transporter